MKKFTAIIITLAFIATQYARQVAYLECTLQNYFLATDKKCDCESVLISTIPMPEEPLPVAHPHTHIDENYFMPNTIVLSDETLTKDRLFSNKPSFIPRGANPGFRPAALLFESSVMSEGQISFDKHFPRNSSYLASIYSF